MYGLGESRAGRLCSGVAAVLAIVAAGSVAAASPAMSAVQQNQLLEHYCRSCHNYQDYAGGVEFEAYDPARAHEDAALTERMLRKVRAGMMPPAGKPRPNEAQLQAFAGALEAEVDAHATPDLAMPALHRLNRVEYHDAVRDLLGLDTDVTQWLPADDVSRGFDNQAGTLTFSPALLDAYLTAAARISRAALGTATAPVQATYRVPEDETQNYHVDGLPFGTRGGLLATHVFPADGTYTVKVFAVNLGNMGNFRPFGEVRGEQLLIYLDGGRVAQVDWDRALHVTRSIEDEGGGDLRSIDVTLPVRAGAHRVGVTFLATNYAPGLDLNHAFERSTIETGGLPGFTFYPHVGRMRIDGPAQATAATDSPVRRRVLTCQPQQAAEEEACARQIAAQLAHRAYRGREGGADIDELMQFYRQGRTNGGFDAGIETLLQRLLVDPKFLFRVESPPPGLTPGQAYRVSDLELASRLSFFLWSSVPDDELLRLAAAGTLGQDRVLRQQVRRMLSDPRAATLTTSFADQWLGLRALATQTPVVEQFPDFDDNLRQSFRREVELLFDSLLAEDRGPLDLLTANYTFLDERLAQHYGIAGVRGSHFRRVLLGPEHAERWGLLGKGAILTISSQPGRTSPVVRGNWVLRTLIGVPAPDPPPNVPQLKATAADAAGNARPPSMRVQMERHRADPVCASCHRIMDPIGFALEPFDAIGQWRNEDNGNPIDPRGVLFDGAPVDGPAGVRAFLLRHQDQYLRNFTSALMTYALGRGLEYQDMPKMRAVLQSAAKGGYRLQDLIEAIVTSDSFRMNVAPWTQPPGTGAAPLRASADFSDHDRPGG